MAFYEEQKEQNAHEGRGEQGEQKEYGIQEQRKWYSRFARERTNLSASVEAALEGNQEILWLDDIHDHDSYNAYDQSGLQEQEDEQPQAYAHSTALIPPRLSLQSS